jgi:hypothetical protein
MKKSGVQECLRHGKEGKTSRSQKRGDWSPKLKSGKLDVPVWDSGWPDFS